MEHSRWICPNCDIICAIEIRYPGENMVKCISNHSMGNCFYCETVSETKKRLKSMKEAKDMKNKVWGWYYF
jgi:hypothetical protein